MAIEGASQPDPYRLLGISIDATGGEISRAYRRLARTLHPDRRPGDPSAADQFQAITGAYETLADPARRAEHDKLRIGPQICDDPDGALPEVGPPNELVVRLVIRPEAAPPAGTPLWAGPVYIEPLPARTTRDQYTVDTRLASLAYQLSRLLAAGRTHRGRA